MHKMLGNGRMVTCRGRITILSDLQSCRCHMGASMYVDLPYRSKNEEVFASRVTPYPSSTKQKRAAPNPANLVITWCVTLDYAAHI